MLWSLSHFVFEVIVDHVSTYLILLLKLSDLVVRDTIELDNELILLEIPAYQQPTKAPTYVLNWLGCQRLLRLNFISWEWTSVDMRNRALKRLIG